MDESLSFHWFEMRLGQIPLRSTLPWSIAAFVVHSRSHTSWIARNIAPNAFRSLVPRTSINITHAKRSVRTRCRPAVGCSSTIRRSWQNGTGTRPIYWTWCAAQASVQWECIRLGGRVHWEVRAQQTIDVQLSNCAGVDRVYRTWIRKRPTEIESIRTTPVCVRVMWKKL